MAEEMPDYDDDMGGYEWLYIEVDYPLAVSLVSALVSEELQAADPLPWDGLIKLLQQKLRA